MEPLAKEGRHRADSLCPASEAYRSAAMARLIDLLPAVKAKGAGLMQHLESKGLPGVALFSRIADFDAFRIYSSE